MSAPACPPSNAPYEAAVEQLRRICESNTFRGAGRLRRFLEFIVGEAVAGRRDQIKEYVVGVAVFDKPSAFDPRTDPIVRVRARRLRAMLERYYREEAGPEELLIELPKGGYAPTFHAPVPGPVKPSLAVTLALRNSVAVMPFADFSPQGELSSFCDEIREEIICALNQVRGLRVLARHPADLGANRSAPDEDGAAVLVAGSARVSAGGLRLILHLVDGASGCYLWSGSLEGPLRERWGMQQEVARLLAERVAAHTTGAAESRSLRAAENLAARNLYLQGRYHLGQRTEEGLRKAAEFFERALTEDPRFALAHSGLADAFSLLGHYGVLAPVEVWAKAASNAASAVALDPNSAEAHTSLAHVKSSQDWDWEGAERQYRHAINLDPRYPTAHHWLAMSCLAPLGRLHEALEEVRFARSLDPVSSIIARDVAVVHYFRREFDLALEECDHTIELNPHFAAAFWTLGKIQIQRQDFEEAEAAFQSAVRLAPGAPRMLGALGFLYAFTGNRSACEEVLRQLGKLSPHRYVSPIETASIQFALGETDAAFEWLARAVLDHSFELISLNVDPHFDPWLQDARFAAVVRQLGLSPAPPKPSARRTAAVKPHEARSRAAVPSA